MFPVLDAAEGKMAKNTPRKAVEKPIICADTVVASDHYSLRPYRLTKAILAFLTLRDFPARFCGANGREVPADNYLKMWVKGDTILAGPIFGGPLCAAIMEELAAFGVKSFIGYGASGTLDAGVPPCSIMVAEAGLCSDGTSKEYSERTEELADAALCKMLKGAITRRGLPLISGKVWTTDAIYREFPSKVAYWKSKGARFVNMETSTMYAVAREIGVKAAYISAVSDNVCGEKWSGWHADFLPVYEQMQDICLEVAEAI
jgi:purine-nucleoside phosphorylase